MPPQNAGVATATPAAPAGGATEKAARGSTGTTGETAGDPSRATARPAPETATLLGARVAGVARDGDAALLTFDPDEGPALRLLLPAVFRLARGERTLLADSDLTAPREHQPAGPFEECETRYDARALALNAVLSAVRPVVREVTVLADGGLRVAWGTSFHLEVPGPPASTVTAWRLADLA
ncbi:hypothetical protein [Streptomyces spiramenti]|uniref:Uncharacterized protein n=1 Tax=Streptomyces spiramenti TaxID=2720606 RepID=A0ABX1ADT0_9ACTN|nr:hypothetical protein [Streptomyces spiramenti]NJP65279.1 hypothetical protein [Streptomyces spiramenti]